MLYGQERPLKASSADMRNFLKSSNHVPLGRVVQNILFNIVLPRVGSRDHVSDKDRFVLFHVLQLQKVNLPLLICEHWEQALRDRSAAQKKTPIPYYQMFTQILKKVSIQTSALTKIEDSSLWNASIIMWMQIGEAVMITLGNLPTASSDPHT